MNAKDAAVQINEELVGSYSQNVDVWERGFVCPASDIIQQCINDAVDDALEAAAVKVDIEAEQFAPASRVSIHRAAAIIREMKSKQVS